MTPEIDALIARLHDPDVDDMAAVWAEHHSALVQNLTTPLVAGVTSPAP